MAHIWLTQAQRDAVKAQTDAEFAAYTTEFLKKAGIARREYAARQVINLAHACLEAYGATMTDSKRAPSKGAQAMIDKLDAAIRAAEGILGTPRTLGEALPPIEASGEIAAAS